MLGCECQIELSFFAKEGCYNGPQNSESLLLNHVKLVTQMIKNSILEVKDNTFGFASYAIKKILYSRLQSLKYIFRNKCII